jgi:hypothetical protein
MSRSAYAPLSQLANYVEWMLNRRWINV